MKVLVTGGAGYIGSHMVRTLGEKGFEVVVYDNLSSGFRESILFGDLVIGDLAERGKLDLLFRHERFDAVVHFAASIEVEESTNDPVKYYRNNFENSLDLIEACLKYRVHRLIFSSTAAVYGIPARIPVSEDSELRPINPYGSSKGMVERVLQDIASVSDLRYVALRYFNVAGADELSRIGQRYRNPTHLITLALRTALGLRECLNVFGTDYDTPDGTCVRDYIHVEDLIDAHVLSLEHLLAGGGSGVYNCGYGSGYSVMQVIETVRRVTGVDFPVREAPRREGDSPVLIADSAKIRKELGWKPRYNDLDNIIKSAWEWEKKLNASGQGQAA